MSTMDIRVNQRPKHKVCRTRLIKARGVWVCPKCNVTVDPLSSEVYYG